MSFIAPDDSTLTHHEILRIDCPANRPVFAIKAKFVADKPALFDKKCLLVIFLFRVLEVLSLFLQI